MRVWNRREPGVPVDAVYVGRPSPFGNPIYLRVDSHTEREAVLRRFITFLAENPERVRIALPVLTGRDLVCWCAPKLCHADVWLQIVNGWHEIDPFGATHHNCVDPTCSWCRLVRVVDGMRKNAT